MKMHVISVQTDKNNQPKLLFNYSFVGATHAGRRVADPYELLFIVVYFTNIMYIIRNVYGWFIYAQLVR